MNPSEIAGYTDIEVDVPALGDLRIWCSASFYDRWCREHSHMNLAKISASNR